MSMVINEICINCGNCEPACLNQAISAGENIYLVAHERCTECVGASALALPAAPPELIRLASGQTNVP
jgi:ferredoxin